MKNNINLSEFYSLFYYKCTVMSIMLTVANMQYSWMLLVIAVTTTNIVNGGKVFYVETLFKGTFFQASMYCSKLGFELVTFDNQWEYDELKYYLIRNAQNVKWNQFWTAGVAKGPLKFGWINTGLPVTLTNNWEFLAPNNFFGLENCLEVKFYEDVNVMLMNDVSCLALNSIVCQGFAV